VQTIGADDAKTAMTRSFLFVPGDSERKLANARNAGADALIVDLEDSVAASELPMARIRTREFLLSGAKIECWVRINPLDSVEAGKDLGGILPGKPAGIVLPKAGGAADVAKLGKLLDLLEQEHGIEPGSTGILPIVTERPDALFRLHEYAGSTPRLAALTWGAEDLAAATGASASRDATGQWLPPYQLARSLCLFAAAAAAVSAIDTVYTDFRDLAGLAAYAAAARRDGFRSMLAIHPAQVPVINAAFMPDSSEIEHARKIVALFDSNPKAGTLSLDGRMLDKPHLVQARKILQLATPGSATD
jgi:citrate lyase subunit beta / citryl-CoA lyase